VKGPGRTTEDTHAKSLHCGAAGASYPWDLSAKEEVQATYGRVEENLTKAAPRTSADSLFPHESQADLVGDFIRDEEHGWLWGRHPEVNARQATKIRAAILSRRNAFAYSVAELPGYHGPEGPIHIHLDHRRPIFTSKRKQSDAEKAIQNEKCQELLDNDIIEQAPSSNYASPPVIVAKKDADGQLTDSLFSIDYRRINDATTADLYPMPLPEEIFRECRGARVFSKLDLRAGYHQVPLTESCRNVTAFWWNNNLWRYKRLPFGLKNAPAEFQKRVDLHLGQAGLLHCCRAFMDDLIIFSPDGDSHAEHVSVVLDCLQAEDYECIRRRVASVHQGSNTWDTSSQPRASHLQQLR